MQYWNQMKLIPGWSLTFLNSIGGDKWRWIMKIASFSGWDETLILCMYVARTCICQAFTRREASVFHPRDGKIGQHALRLADSGSRHYTRWQVGKLCWERLGDSCASKDDYEKIWKYGEWFWGQGWHEDDHKIYCLLQLRKRHFFVSLSDLFLSRLACCLDSKITLSLLSSRLWCSMTLEPAIGHTHTSYWQEHRCILAECTNRHIEKDTDTPTHIHTDTQTHANTRTNG